MALLGGVPFSTGASNGGDSSLEAMQLCGSNSRNEQSSGLSGNRSTAPAALFSSLSSAARAQPSSWARRAAALARATDYTSAILQARHYTAPDDGGISGTHYDSLGTDDIYIESDDGARSIDGSSMAGYGTAGNGSTGPGTPCYSGQGIAPSNTFQSTTSRFQSDQGSDLSTYSIGGGPASSPQRVHGTSGEPLTWSQVIYLWQNDEEFTDSWSDSLCQCPYGDFFLEMAPITPTSAANAPFEFVLQDAQGLLDGTPANPRLFLQHIFAGQDSNEVVTFHNEVQRADLVAPCQNGCAEEYAHLASFLRSAPMEQVRNLWRTLGRRVEERLDGAGGGGEGGGEGGAKEPLWVSTNGVGIPWVHVRLDSNPRYYSYKPWKAAPGRHQHKGGGRGSKGPGRQTMPSLLSNSTSSQRPRQQHQQQPDPSSLASLAADGAAGGGSRSSRLAAQHPGPHRREEEEYEPLEEGDKASGSPFAASAGGLRGPEFSAASPDSGHLRHRHLAAPPRDDEGGGLLLKGEGSSPQQKHHHQGPGGHDRRSSSTGGGAAAAAAAAALRPSSSSELYHLRNNSVFEAASGMSFASTLGSGPSMQSSVARSDDLYAASVASTHISCGCFSAAARLIKRAKIKRKGRKERLRHQGGGGDSLGGGRGASSSPLSSGFPSPRNGFPSPIREVQLY